MPPLPLTLGYNQAIDNKLLDIPGSGIFHNTKGFRDPSGRNSAVFNNFGKYRLLTSKGYRAVRNHDENGVV